MPLNTEISTEGLSDDEVQVWHVCPEEVTHPPLVKQYLEMLTADELGRYRRFIPDDARHRFLIGRGMLRRALATYTGVAPEDWRFQQNSFGRPEVLAPAEFTHLRFNVSHTSGQVACAVALRRDVGVDVEDARRQTPTLELARRYFSPGEVADLEPKKGDDLRRRFFEFWTLKESYVKARGMGLSIPLAEFSFRFSEAGTIGIRFAAGFGDVPSVWQFYQRWMTPQHPLAISVRRQHEPDLAIVLNQGLP